MTVKVRPTLEQAWVFIPEFPCEGGCNLASIIGTEAVCTTGCWRQMQGGAGTIEVSDAWMSEYRRVSEKFWELNGYLEEEYRRLRDEERKELKDQMEEDKKNGNA